MNIAVVGTPPVPPPVVPAVAPAAAPAQARTASDTPSGNGANAGRKGTGAGTAPQLTDAERAERARAEADRALRQLKLQVPEVRHLSTREMQVMMGALPPAALNRGHAERLDTYA